jgi:hypothetical protein
MTDNPDHIPGIYNYCDRWCERCPFTVRCMNYEMDRGDSTDPEDRDVSNAAFWQRLHGVFESTIEMIEQFAEEQGIDLSDLDVESAIEDQAKIDEAARDEACVRLSEQYGKMVNEWFRSSEDLFSKKGEQLELEARTELPGADPEAEAADLEDAVEVIRWYQHQIYVKLMRAVTGQLEGTPETLVDYPKDSDGSAKVALVAVDRSIAAWGSLREHFPDEADDLLDVLVALERVRRRAEEVFPNARAFVRPGFDEA